MNRKIVNPIIKDTVTFIRTSAETDGQVSEIEITLMPGCGNPLHYHKTYTETFTAIHGELGIKTSKKSTKILKPGETHTVQPMGIHCFFNPSDKEIKFRVQIKPGHQGFEHSLRILYRMAADGLTNKKSIPKSLKHIALIACMSDMNAPGLLTLIFRLLRVLPKKQKGMAKNKSYLTNIAKHNSKSTGYNMRFASSRL